MLSSTSMGCGDQSPQAGQSAQASTAVRRVEITAVPANEGDRALIRHMTTSGVDLARPHLVDFIFTAPSADALQKVCDDLNGRGYKTAVEPPSVAHSTPICRATRSMVVTLEVIAKSRAELEKLAKALGAELDGWELDPR